MTTAALPAARTALAVSSGIETIAGVRSPWRFRPHYHAGDEMVTLRAGRTRLRLPTGWRLLEAGETVVIPAGTIHRFEPLDAEGWAFSSRFVPRKDATPHPPHALVGRAIALLAQRDSLRSGTEALAGACHVSAGYLTRAFRRGTGTSPHNFHVLLVLQKAKALLRAGAPLAAAALDSGFYDQSHLTREFVRTYGFTPKVFQSAWSAGA